VVAVADEVLAVELVAKVKVVDEEVIGGTMLYPIHLNAPRLGNGRIGSAGDKP
jgi:hypothetical protein